MLEERGKAFEWLAEHLGARRLADPKRSRSSPNPFGSAELGLDESMSLPRTKAPLNQALCARVVGGSLNRQQSHVALVDIIFSTAGGLRVRSHTLRHGMARRRDPDDLRARAEPSEAAATGGSAVQR